MNEKDKKTISKFLSLVLRHEPEKIELTLNENGWADVEELLLKTGIYGYHVNRNDLEEIVSTNDKKRFAFSDDKTKIRANQGHSIEVALDLVATPPPEYLYHGTVAKFIESIQLQGLQKMSRQHVHLSSDKETALKVGSRRGQALILTVESGRMHKDGFEFFISENGVWLTDHVPAGYINF